MAGKEGNGQIVEACECYRKINFLISHGSHRLVFKHWCDIFRLGLKNGQGGKETSTYSSRAFSGSNQLQDCHSGQEAIT